MAKTREDWTKEVKIELIKRNMSLVDLAGKSDYSYSTIRKVMSGERTHERVIKNISQVMGIIPFEE